jgi:hypothetical protein
MIHPTRILLTAALGLIMSATAQAAPTPTLKPIKPASIPIFSLPFTISAPGTYTVTQNLTGSLWISTGVQGPIVVDLGGFTLTGGGAGGSISDIGILIGGFPDDPDASNPAPITIENGTVSNVSFGVWVGAGSLMSDVLIKNLTVNIAVPTAPNYAIGIFMERTTDSTIRNCTVTAPPGNSPAIGIKDSLSPGGNSYSNITFRNVRQLLDVEPYEFGANAVLNACSVADPTPIRTP